MLEGEAVKWRAFMREMHMQCETFDKIGIGSVGPALRIALYPNPLPVRQGNGREA